ERAAGHGRETAADRGAERAGDEGAERATGNRQRGLERAFQGAADGLPDGRAHHRADGATDLLDQVAEKAVELLLVAHFEQFGGELHLVGFAENPATAFPRPFELLAFEQLELGLVLGEGTSHDWLLTVLTRD